MYCPQCGTPNAEAARFCEKCGMALATPAPGPAAVAPSYVPPAGAPVGGVGTAPTPQQVPSPQQAWQPPPPPPSQGYVDPRTPQQFQPGKRFAVRKDPTVALLLSIFISPVGQFYNGDVKKGLTMLVLHVIGVLLWSVGIGFLLTLGVWIWSVVDAHMVASGKAPLW